MVDSIPEPPSLDPTSLGSASFPRARKGFEPTQVHATLGRVADALRAWELRDTRLQERIAALETQLQAAQAFDESHLTAVLGEETMRVLSAARESAAEIRAKAEEDAERLKSETAAAAQSAAEALKKEAQTLRDEAAAELAQANSESRQLRETVTAETEQLRESAEQRAAELLEHAESVLSERTAAAEEAAASIRESVEVLRLEAEQQSAELLASAKTESEDLIEQAKERGRQIIADTKALREEMLRDLAERRALARRQIDLILAGRDQMLEVLKGAESTVAGAITELETSLEPAVDSSENVSEESVEDISKSIAEFTGLLEDTPEVDDRVMMSPEVTEPEVTTPEAIEQSDGDADSQEEVADSSIQEHGTHETPPTVEDVEDVGEVSNEGESSTGSSGLDLVGDLDDGEIIDLDSVEKVGADQDVATSLSNTELLEDLTPDEVDSLEHVRLIDSDQADNDEDDVAVGTTTDEVAASSVEPNVSEDSIEDEPAVVSTADVETPPTATVHDLFERLRAEQTDEYDEDDDEDFDSGAGHSFVDAGSGNRKPAPVVELTRIDKVPAAASEVADAGMDTAASAVGTLTHTRSEDEETSSDDVGVINEEADTAGVITGDQGLLDLRDELLGPIEKGLGRALKRLISDEQNVILDALRRTKKQRPTAEDILPNENESAAEFIAALQSDFEEALAAGGIFWEQSGGIAALPLFGEESNHSKVLEDPVREFVSAHHARLAKIFADSETEALDIDDIIDRVRAVYRDTRSSTLNEVASAIAISGFTAGELDAAEPGTPCRWLLDNGGLPCPDGEDNALAGAVGAGSPFPTGHYRPPAHRGCRCILAPIIQ